MTTPKKDDNIPEEQTEFDALLRSFSATTNPASSWREMEQVLSALLNEESTMSVQEALERVAVWKIRATTISHSVESISALAAIRLKDSAGSSTTTTELRLEYSCAVIRAVNGLVDPLQQNRATASSVRHLAGTIGIPRWLVDIRHEATHQQLHPLPTLRMAAQAMLEYFRVAFFQPWKQSKLDGYNEIMDILEEFDENSAAEQVERNEQKAKEIEAEQNGERSGEGNNSVAVDAGPDYQSAHPSFSLRSNPFAMLVEKKLKPGETSVETKKKRKRKRPMSKTERTSKVDVMLKFLKTNVPVDIVLEAALDFLVKDKGVLVLPDFESAFERYQLLVCHACRAWPGLYRALVICCLDTLFATSNQNSMLWIQFLLSKPFMEQLCTRNAPSVRKLSSGQQPIKIPRRSLPDWQLLNYHQIPIRALYDRCQMAVKTNSCPFVKQTGDFLQSIIDKCFIKMDQVPEKTQSACQETDDRKLPPLGTKLSLDELEALLGEDTPKQVKQAANIRQTKWQRCEHWEASAIGTLPGHL